MTDCPILQNYNDFLCNIWANNKSVQRALYVRKVKHAFLKRKILIKGCYLTIVFNDENQGTVSVCTRCNMHLPYQKDVESTVSYHFYLNSKGYRALIYRFDHIPFCPITSGSICKQHQTAKEQNEML